MDADIRALATETAHLANQLQKWDRLVSRLVSSEIGGDKEPISRIGKFPLLDTCHSMINRVVSIFKHYNLATSTRKTEGSESFLTSFNTITWTNEVIRLRGKLEVVL